MSTPSIFDAYRSRSALIVPVGYFLYETLLYGTASAIPNILFNTMQCLIGAVVATIIGVMLLKTKLFSREDPAKPVCAEILREPKNGPDVVLVATRAQAELIKTAGDMLSVQGVMARIVVLDDGAAFDRLPLIQRERFVPQDKPFVRVTDAETTPKAIMQAALEARAK